MVLNASLAALYVVGGTFSGLVTFVGKSCREMRFWSNAVILQGYRSMHSFSSPRSAFSFYDWVENLPTDHTGRGPSTLSFSVFRVPLLLFGASSLIPCRVSPCSFSYWLDGYGLNEGYADEAMQIMTIYQ